MIQGCKIIVEDKKYVNSKGRKFRIAELNCTGKMVRRAIEHWMKSSRSVVVKELYSGNMEVEHFSSARKEEGSGRRVEARVDENVVYMDGGGVIEIAGSGSVVIEVHVWEGGERIW